MAAVAVKEGGILSFGGGDGLAKLSIAEMERGTVVNDISAVNAAIL